MILLSGDFREFDVDLSSGRSNPLFSFGPMSVFPNFGFFVVPHEINYHFVYDFNNVRWGEVKAQQKVSFERPSDLAIVIFPNNDKSL